MNTLRQKRMELFHKLMMRVDRAAPVSILDVGGTPSFWLGKIPHNCTLTLVNLDHYLPLQGETVLHGDACDLMAMLGRRRYDVVFSNSLIAQVPVDRQALLADQLRRAGDRYFIQTPNQGFPIDWRTRMPAFHWLPRHAQAWVIERIALGPLEKARDRDDAIDIVNRIHDVTESQLKRLFPDGTVVRERIMGLTKSFIVHRGF
jgi:hypothetical protein